MGLCCVFMYMMWIYDVAAIVFTDIANPSEVVFG